MDTCSRGPTASCLPVAAKHPQFPTIMLTLSVFLQGQPGSAMPHLSSRSGGPTASTGSRSGGPTASTGSLNPGQQDSSQLRSAATTATTASGRQSRDVMHTRASTDT